MAKRRNRLCRECGLPGAAGDELSARGLHASCAQARVADSITSMRERTGPTYRKWLEAQVHATERIVADAVSSGEV